jgi:hypothetical protein
MHQQLMLYLHLNLLDELVRLQHILVGLDVLLQVLVHILFVVVLLVLVVDILLVLLEL